MAEKKRTVDKFKRKVYYDIVAPKAFGGKVIGETLAEKSALLKGRVLRVTRDQLPGGNRRQRYITVSFRILDVKGTSASTEPVAMKVDGGYLNRLVRRRRSKVATHLLLSFKDKSKARVSVVSVTMRKIERARERALRHAMTQKLIEIAKKSTFKKFFESALSEELVNALAEAQKPIAPVKRIEIIKLRLLSG